MDGLYTSLTAVSQKKLIPKGCRGSLVALLMALVVGTNTGCGPVPPPQLEPILVEDFEEGTTTEIRTRLTRHEKIEVSDGIGRNGSRGIIARYVGYSRGSERIVSRIPIGERGSSFTLCYDVMFDEDFQFVRGGKIMGLGPEHKITGGQKMTPGGWSARSNFGADGIVHTYIYSQNKTGKWGDSRHSATTAFQKGTYHTVTLQVRLNEPVGQANGVSKIYVDGQLHVDHDNIQFRSVPGDSTLISALLFETFHGGNTESFAPRDASGDLQPYMLISTISPFIEDSISACLDRD